MGLCKCREVTNLFCFEHRKNVCEKCLVSDHSRVSKPALAILYTPFIVVSSRCLFGCVDGGWGWRAKLRLETTSTVCLSPL